MREEDVFGNTIDYEYFHGAAHKRSYIESIRYTANPRLGIAANAEIFFVYEDRPDVSLQYISGSEIVS